MRISADRSIPEHFEAVPLRPLFRAIGLMLGGGGIAGGIAIAATAEGSLATLGAPLVALSGGLVLAAVMQCRRFEVTIGTKRIELGAGPFRQTVASGAVEATSVGVSTGWRRLYADQEVTLRHGFGDGTATLPSADPNGIVEVVSRIANLPRG